MVAKSTPVRQWQQPLIKNTFFDFRSTDGPESDVLQGPSTCPVFPTEAFRQTFAPAARGADDARRPEEGLGSGAAMGQAPSSEKGQSPTLLTSTQEAKGVAPIADSGSEPALGDGAPVAGIGQTPDWFSPAVGTAGLGGFFASLLANATSDEAGCGADLNASTPAASEPQQGSAAASPGASVRSAPAAASDGAAVAAEPTPEWYGTSKFGFGSHFTSLLADATRDDFSAAAHPATLGRPMPLTVLPLAGLRPVPTASSAAPHHPLQIPLATDFAPRMLATAAGPQPIPGAGAPRLVVDLERELGFQRGAPAPRSNPSPPVAPRLAPPRSPRSGASNSPGPKNRRRRGGKDSKEPERQADDPFGSLPTSVVISLSGLCRVPRASTCAGQVHAEEVEQGRVCGAT